MNNTPEIVRQGWLKRIKNQKKRYFVLSFNKESGAAQFQYYENEKKFHSKSEPKRTIYLRDCLGIIAREDPKEGHVLVLYTKEDIFSLTSETNGLLQSWLSDLDKLHKMENKNLLESKYDLVWNVTIIPRGLGGIKNMTGPYKLCLKNEVLYFVNPVSQEVVNEEKLCYVRRYGHMDYCFFMEFGRSTTLGAGEIWMKVEDPLIAQKIHETLSRSVKPMVSGEHTEKKKPKHRPNRHSMNVDHKSLYTDLLNNNNEPSPKTRRSFLNVFKKQRDTTRPHSKSMSGDPSLEPENVMRKLSNLSPYVNQSVKDGDGSDEDTFYPISPPIPSISKRPSKSSLPALPTKDISPKNEKKGITGASDKSLTENSGNDYALLKPKRRSVVKQDCSTVRQGYAAEQRRSRSLPRRPSSSSTERQRIGSNRSIDSDKDGDLVSDDEERRHSFDDPGNHYLNLNPFHSRITSDSSLEEPFPAVETCPSGPPGHYIEMRSPQHRMSPEKSRCSTSSFHSSDSAEDPPLPDHGNGENPYINMSPGQYGKIGSSSNNDTGNGAAADTCEEMFDHLHRDEFVTKNTSHSDEQCYVNMKPQSLDSGSLKSRAEIQRKKTSDYVNVNMNRSRSVGNRTSRPRPLFEILPERDNERASSDDETSRHMPGSYVNMRIKKFVATNSNPDLVNGNHASTEKAVGDSRKTSALNYASVEFSESRDSRPNGVNRTSRIGRKSHSNYSTIDFTKSKGLEEMSSSRELQLQQGHH